MTASTHAGHDLRGAQATRTTLRQVRAVSLQGQDAHRILVGLTGRSGRDWSLRGHSPR